MKKKKYLGSIRGELYILLAYAAVFYVFVIRRSLQISVDHYKSLYVLRHGWLSNFFNDVSDAHWRNFRSNIPILSVVFGVFATLASSLRAIYHFRAKGMSILWLFLSLVYLFDLHGGNNGHIWTTFGGPLDGIFASTLKRVQCCQNCKFGKSCLEVLQEKSFIESFTISVYLYYLLDVPQDNCSQRDVVLYGLCWVFSLFLMELMTHLFYYNAFAISGIRKLLSPLDVFIIGYGKIAKGAVTYAVVLNFIWLKLLLIWRYFLYWSLICGIKTWENMLTCLNNCHNLETFWKNWHAFFNKWLVRYMYLPLGGSRIKLLNVWPIFMFVAVWHDLEWKLLLWAWLACLFFIPEMVVKSAMTAFQAESAFGEFIFREQGALAGAISITCLMIANLVGYVIGPSGVNWLMSQFLTGEGLPVLGGMFITFYVAAKLLFHIQDAKQRQQ